MEQKKGDDLKSRNKHRYYEKIMWVFDNPKDAGGVPTTVEEICVYANISIPTFYDHFPLGSEEINAIKERLRRAKVDLKNKLKGKWFGSRNATLQIALFKLIADDDERKKLSQQYHDHTSQGEKMGMDLSNLDDSELESYARLMAKIRAGKNPGAEPGENEENG